jgi:hypothetical protein
LATNHDAASNPGVCTVNAGGEATSCNPLLLTIRNTLPNTSTFPCSGQAVPYSTAEYTDAGGLMGPYVPQVDYVDARATPA